MERRSIHAALRSLTLAPLVVALAACGGGDHGEHAHDGHGHDGHSHDGHSHDGHGHGEADAPAASAPGTTAPHANGDSHGISHVSLPPGLVVRGEPAGTPVAECKASAKQGDTVTVVGRIGGSRVPFTHDVAMFTIVDPSLKSCADGSDPDHCKTPWDYCCEDRAAMKRGMATIELVDAQGMPFGFPVRGASGLEPLATVAVTGTVVEKNDAGMMVVRASKVIVK